MPADDELGGQFDIVHQGETPLLYNRGGTIQRYAVVNPEAALTEETPRPSRWASARHVAETDYWHSRHIIGMGNNDRRLKQPKEIRNPSAAAPGTVSFADVTPQGDDVYINYMNTREDQRGLGHASRLVGHIAEQHPGIIHFGKVMNPRIWSLKEKLEEQGRRTLGHRDF